MIWSGKSGRELGQGEANFLDNLSELLYMIGVFGPAAGGSESRNVFNK
jgi:hypothetical protein